MARKLTVGFEENDLAATSIWDGTLNSSPSVVTSPVHSGVYAMRCNPTAGAQNVFKDLGLSKTSGTLWVRFYIRIASAPDAATPWVRLQSSGSANSIVVGLRTTSKIYLRNGVTATETDTASALSANTWYRVEYKAVLADSGGSAELKYFVGESATAEETLSISNEDTLPTNVDRLIIGNTSNTTADIYFDDIALNTEAGAVDNDYPGPGKISLLKPASDSSVQFTRNTGSVNAENVDEKPGVPDDVTTYNYSTTAGHIDRLNVGTLHAEVTSDATMKTMMVFARVGSGSASSTSGRLKVWDEGGTPTDGISSNWSTGSAGGWRQLSWGSQPIYDLTGKTKANVESFDIGYEKVTDTNEGRISDLWANVEWTESAGAEMEGAISASATASAYLGTVQLFVADIENTSLATIDLTISTVVEASVNAAATTAGDLTTSILMAASVSGAATTVSDLTTSILLVGSPTVRGEASASADLQITSQFDADAEATATVAADLTTSITMVTAISASASASAELTSTGAAATFEASITGQATASAYLGTLSLLIASVSGVATTEGDLTTTATPLGGGGHAAGSSIVFRRRRRANSVGRRA